MRLADEQARELRSARLGQHLGRRIGGREVRRHQHERSDVIECLVPGHRDGKRRTGRHADHDELVADRSADGQGFGSIVEPLLGARAGQRIVDQSVARETGLEQVRAELLREHVAHGCDLLTRRREAVQVDDREPRARPDVIIEPADALLRAGNDRRAPVHLGFVRIQPDIESAVDARCDRLVVDGARRGRERVDRHDGEQAERCGQEAAHGG